MYVLQVFVQLKALKWHFYFFLYSSIALLKRHSIDCSNYTSELQHTGASLAITILYRKKIEEIEREGKKGVGTNTIIEVAKKASSLFTHVIHFKKLSLDHVQLGYIYRIKEHNRVDRYRRFGFPELQRLGLRCNWMLSCWNSSTLSTFLS